MESGCKPAADWRIGAEHEKFGWLTDTRQPLPYAGDRSIAAMFAGLEARFGWPPVREGEFVIGLTRNGANVSLEPGGQFELSGAPLVSCLLYTSDAADELLCVDLGGRRNIKKKTKHKHKYVGNKLYPNFLAATTVSPTIHV